MSRFYSYIRTAQQMLAGYNGSLPFAPFAKAFFAKEKKYGSTDRRQISALCYSYFRVAKALGKMEEEDKFIAAVFLCEKEPNKLLENLKPEWNAAVQLPLQEKAALLADSFNEIGLFPFENELSPLIDKEAFRLSYLHQPHLFLRLRPGQEALVKKKLTGAAIPFTEVNEHCLSLVNGTAIEEVIAINKEAVVQDFSSQKTGLVMQEQVLRLLPAINSWDCCAASGGKTLMLHDLRPDAVLTVSDVRTSIIHNLKERFRQAGIRKYGSFVADVSKPEMHLPGNPSFNLIIADVPCTGSGTWARTPEQLYFFTAEKIGEYARRQQQIAGNALQHLQPGGYLVYITCSVFEEENETVVEQLIKEKKLKRVHQQYLAGYQMKADTLFIAVLQK